MQKLSVKGLAVAFGVITAFFMLFISWAAMFGWGGEMVDLMSTYYIGTSASWLGGIIGAIWGFIDGAICGAIIAWIYNRFV